jgi:putative transposase
MDHHLADSTQDEVSEGEKACNHRNGYSKKTVLTENEALELSIPRDGRCTFEPQLIAKYQRRFPGFDDKIISMYARGMSTREIQGHLRDLYGIEATPQLISTVTDAVLEEVSRWQSRPLDPCYALVCFDALRVKMRDGAQQRGLSCDRRESGGPQRRIGDLDRADRRGEVLAACDDGD